MYVITFYSFKGGVGRTLALVNVAAELASKGRRVLLVDFDLEAPGLETFDRLRPREPHQGVVEYVKEYLSSKRSPDVRDYVYSAGTVGKAGGELLVMSAGRRDAKYQAALMSIDWKRLYHDCQGYWFFEDTKKQWEEAFNPHYVLIDSRTGHTDVEGTCTRQLPDAVVVLFFPNEQNLVGLRDVCRRIRGEKENGLKKDIRLHFVMSNVPDLDDEDKILRRRLGAFHKDLGIQKLAARIHRYESAMHFNQALFVLDRPRSRLAREYRLLTRAAVAPNPADREGALLFLQEVQKERSLLINWSHYRGWEQQRQQIRRSMLDPFRDHLKRITGQFLDDAEVLLRIAECYQRYGDPELALNLFDRVLTLKPDCADGLFQRGLCHRQLRDDAKAAVDLLDYLRTHGCFDRKDSPLSRDEQRKRTQRNARALLELLSISVEAFQRALALPAVPVALDDSDSWGNSHGVALWLFEASERLILQRRWKDAIRYLETTVKERIPLETNPGWQKAGLIYHQFFFLSMAHWGESGQPRRDLCSQALALLRPYVTEVADVLDTIWFQELALLSWGAGEVEEAATAIDRALARLDETDEIIDGKSMWTFQETTPREYRADCLQLRRMIQGEPIRPAFLGEPSTPDVKDTTLPR